MAHDPLYQAHGARLEISVPGLSKANAQRSVASVLGRGGGGDGDGRRPAANGADWARQALGSGHAQAVAGDWPTAGADPDF